jgi:hypothetical protein
VTREEQYGIVSSADLSPVNFLTRKEQWREWVLLDGNRYVIAGGLSVGFGMLTFAILYGLGGITSNTQSLFYVFSSLIGGNITLITVVASINQLLLSQTIQTPGQLQSQVENIIEYRSEVEEAAGEIAPAEPLGFLQLLFENTREEAQRAGGLATVESDRSETAIDDLVEELTDHIDDIRGYLDQPDMETFDVLSTTLTTNYANQINRTRQIRDEYDGQLSDATLGALDALIDRLQEIDIARQYFKSIYLQRELSLLSRLLLYGGIPAEAASMGALVLFATPVTGTSRLFVAIVPVLITVSLIPLGLLLSFIVRITTVTQRTAATIPFTTPGQEK